MIEFFHRPSTIQEAVSLKTRFGGRAVFLAGGTFVNSSHSPRNAVHCVSLQRLKLQAIEQHSGDLVIGALCTLQQLIEEEKVPTALKVAASQIVSRNIRNMATIGGHVATNQSHSDLIPMLVALEAKVRVAGSGSTAMISLLDYVTAPRVGLITRIIVPVPGRGRVAACGNVRGSANARSILTAAVSVNPGRAIIKDPILALGGVARHVVRLTSVEEVLDGKPLPAIDELAQIISRSVNPSGTPFESAAYKKYQVGTVVALALQKAVRQKGSRR
jgi:putative selenate reductase FAD-binding subunit